MSPAALDAMPVGSTSGPPFAARLVRDVPAERAAPWAVLALALFLRLWHIDLTRFSNEAVWLLQATNDFIKTGHIPLHSGLAFSVGAWAPPLITFLLAPLVIVSRDPLWISAGLSALDAFGSVFVFWGARRLTSSTWAGMAAGLAYAAAPAALIYGRMVWNVTLVPVLSAVALWGLIEFWMQRRSLALAVALGSDRRGGSTPRCQRDLRRALVDGSGGRVEIRSLVPLGRRGGAADCGSRPVYGAATAHRLG